MERDNQVLDKAEAMVCTEGLNHDSDTMLLGNGHEESVEQINLFIDGKFKDLEGSDGGQHLDSQAILDESLKALADQDSDVFRVASEVASCRDALESNRQDKDESSGRFNGDELQLRPALVEQRLIDKQASFGTNELAELRGSAVRRSYESMEAPKPDR